LAVYEATGESLDVDGPDPRARALRWYLGHMRRGWRDASEDDVRAAHRSDDAIPPAQRLRFVSDYARRLPPLEIDEIVAVSLHEGMARLHDEKGRRYRLRVLMHPPEPDRLRHAVLTQEPPSGTAIRLATPADGPALAELQRRVPVVDGAVRRTYDRGADYLVAATVADEQVVLVAEVDGVVCGMASQVYHSARAAGRLLRLAYIRHVRVDPAVQGRGVFSALNGAAAEYAIPHCDAPWSLTAIGNATVDNLGMRNIARSPVAQLRIDVRATARSTPLPPAPGPGEAKEIAAFLEKATGGLELSRPWGAAEVEARVGRVGPRYGWDRLAFAQGALVGIEGTPITVVTEGPEGRSVRREVLAFDLAALPGRERELGELVRAFCARLADESVDDLLVTVACPSLLSPLAELAAKTMRFYLNHQFAVAPDADGRGYFIDGMLF